MCDLLKLETSVLFSYSTVFYSYDGVHNHGFIQLVWEKTEMCKRASFSAQDKNIRNSQNQLLHQFA